MQRIKYVLIGFIACVVVLLVLMGLLFFAPVQKVLFLTLASNSGLIHNVDVDSIDLGLDGLNLKKLSFDTVDGRFSIEHISIDAPLLALATEPTAEIGSIDIKGVVLDLSAYAEEEGRPLAIETAPQDVPEGGMMTLPALQDIEIFKEIALLQGSGDAKVIISEEEYVDVVYELRDLASGQPGSALLEWTWHQPTFASRYGTERILTGEVSMSLKSSDQGVLQAVEVEALTSAIFDGHESEPLVWSNTLIDSDNGYGLQSALVLAGDSEVPVEIFSGLLELPRSLAGLKFRGRAAFDTEELESLLDLLKLDLPVNDFQGDVAIEYLKAGEVVIAEATGTSRYGETDNRFDLVFNGKFEPALQGRVTGFLSSTAGSTGARLELSDIDFRADGSGDLGGEATVVFHESGERERLSLKALLPANDVQPISVQVASETLSVPLLQAVADAFVASMPERGVSSGASGEASTPAVENPFQTERPIVLAGTIGRLVIEEPWSLDQVEMNTLIDKGVLDLRKMDFNFLSGRFANTGQIGFTDGSFNLMADSQLRGLTVQSAMTTLGFAPIVETTLHGDVSWEASALSMASLVDNMAVEWHFQGEEGSIDIPESSIMRGMRGATQAASIIGSLIPGQGYLGNFSKIMDYANVVKLEEVSFKGQRESGGLLNIDQLEIKGSDFYADVAGEIRSGSWSDIVSSAARLRLNLGSKGQVSELAEKIGLSDGRLRGDYQLWGKIPFTITGTLEKLDFGPLKSWALEKVTGPAPKFKGSDDTPQSESPADQLKRETSRLLDGLLNAVSGG